MEISEKLVDMLIEICEAIIKNCFVFDDDYSSAKCCFCSRYDEHAEDCIVYKAKEALNILKRSKRDGKKDDDLSYILSLAYRFSSDWSIDNDEDEDYIDTEEEENEEEVPDERNYYCG